MRWSWEFPFLTTLIAGYFLVVQSTSPTSLLQEPAHVRIPPSLPWAPRPSPLQPYFKSPPPFTVPLPSRLGRSNKKMQNWTRCNESSQDADSGVWSKGFCSTLKSSNVSLLFHNRLESTALLPLLPETAAMPCQVQKLHHAAAQQLTVAGCQFEQHWWSWAPWDGGCQLPLPAAQGSLTSQRAINKHIMTARLWDTQVQKLFKDGEPAWRMLWDRAGEGYELKNGKLRPPPIKQKLVMGWEIITEE